MNKLSPISYEEKIAGWHDEETNRDYRRIVGGLAWPHVDMPGFAVIIGEEFKDLGPARVPEQDSVLMYVLQEAESGNLDALLRFCAIHMRKVTWYGNIFDTVNMLHLRDFNRVERDTGRPQLSLLPPPPLYSEGDLKKAFEHGIDRILVRTSDRKTLIVGDNPLIRVCRDSVPKDAAENPEEYPRLLALCFAVNALDRIPWVHPQADSKPAFALTEYDIFDPPWEKKRED